MRNGALRNGAIGLAIWIPFFAMYFCINLSINRSLWSIFFFSFYSMSCAGALAIIVWHVCRRYRWPLQFNAKFYFAQVVFGFLYGLAWASIVGMLEVMRDAEAGKIYWSTKVYPYRVLLGLWFYAVAAGISYAVQTRSRLHEKEVIAARAEALVSEARLDALRARLNPHFLFNALHTLSALVKFRPAVAEGAIERLGDMLRYTLKEDKRGLVEFAEEYEFTREYLDFEQLRYEKRLRVEMQAESKAYNFDLPPFSMQTLAENAVHHAIATRPEGGAITISCSCKDDGYLQITVNDDGPGNAPEPAQSHQFGLRSLRERLAAAFGPASELRINNTTHGCEAVLLIPAPERSGDS